MEKTPEKEKKILRGKELALHYDRTITTILFCNDMVCSAVSCSSVGALNALENPKGFKIVIEDGYLELRNICDITKHDQIVIETLIIQLKSIEESYPKYIKVVEKGN